MANEDELKTGPTMYSQSAREALQEKLAYELWLLDFLLDPAQAGSDDHFRPGITYRNGQHGAMVSLRGHVTIGGKLAQKVIDAMCPLTFVTCYKVLDMVFEWVLEENSAAANIGRVPWKFAEKIPLLRGLHAGCLPTLMQTDPPLREYLLALYEELLDYRNEIVHRRCFTAADGLLSIGPTEKGRPELKLDRKELTVLARVALTSVRYLVGDAYYGLHEVRLVTHRLDQIRKCHGLALFGGPEPVLEDARLIVPGDGTRFSADLAWLREQVTVRHPGKAVLFNLEVVGTVDGKAQYAWRFPYDRVPGDAVCEFRPESHSEYAVCVSDIAPL